MTTFLKFHLFTTLYTLGYTISHLFTTLYTFGYTISHLFTTLWTMVKSKGEK